METKNTTVFVLVILLLGTPVNGWGWIDVFCYCGAFVVGAGAVVAAPAVLAAVGFTSAGIAAGSTAASLMSASAALSGGGVVAGGAVATLQSAGVAGLGLGAKVVIATAAGATYQNAVGGWDNVDC